MPGILSLSDEVFWLRLALEGFEAHKGSMKAKLAGMLSPCLLGSTPASESSLSRRVTSACKESESFAVLRTSFVSSTASLSLFRLLSSSHLGELAQARESTSAQRSSSQQASAASARARSRS